MALRQAEIVAGLAGCRRGTFPLSPTRLLVMDNRHDEPDAQYYPLKYDPASMNCLIWRNSMEHMFSPRHPDIICAEIATDAERSGFL